MTNVLNVDAMDKMLFSEASRSNRLVKDIFWDKFSEKDDGEDIPEVADPSDPFYSLLEDGFGSFYKWAPKVKEKVPAASGLQKKVIEQMMDLNEYERLRHYTRGDEHNSAAALDVVKNVFDSLPEEVKEQQEQLDQTQEKLNDLLDADPIDGNEEALQDQIEGLTEELGKQGQQMDKMLDKHEDQIRQSTRAEMSEAVDQAEAQEQAENALGWGSERGVLPQVAPEDRVKIAEALKQNPNLKRLVDMAGRMIRIAEKKQKQKSQYAREEISGIELGNYLPDVIMDEFLLLMEPDLESLFYKRYFESELHQYELKGKEKLGKGDLVVLVDCSSSMSGLSEMWSKALALAIYSIANKQKRNFMWAMFNTDVRAYGKLNAGEKDLDQVLKMITHGSSGGTSFEAPLKFVQDWHVGSDKLDLEEADIIFITDGQAALSDEFIKDFNERKEFLGFHVYSIVLARGTNNSLDAFSDKVIKVSDLLAEEGKVFDVAFSV